MAIETTSITGVESVFETMTVQPETVPDLLSQWNYDRQRPVRTSVVQRYAEQMRDGHWRTSILRIGSVRGKNENGRPVKREFLLDGQHRLHACALSGKPITFHVLFQEFESVKDINAEYAVIDGHGRRTVTDAQKAMGVLDVLGIAHIGLLRATNAAARIIASDFNRKSHSQDDTERYGVFGSEDRATLPLLWKNELHAIDEILTLSPGPESRHAWQRGVVMGVTLLLMRYQREAWEPLYREAVTDNGLSRDTHAYVLSRQVNIHLKGEDDIKASRVLATIWNSFKRGNERMGPIHAATHNEMVLDGTPWAGRGTPEKLRIERFHFFGADARVGGSLLSENESEEVK